MLRRQSATDVALTSRHEFRSEFPSFRLGELLALFGQTGPVFRLLQHPSAIIARRPKPLEDLMFPTPKHALSPNTYAYESEPLVKPTGFREYDARWLLGDDINLMGVQARGLGLGTLTRALGQRPETVT